MTPADRTAAIREPAAGGRRRPTALPRPLGSLAPFPAVGTEVRSLPSLFGPDVLARMVDTYRTCKSYRDTGVVRTLYIEETGRRIEERPFKTAFVRPASFRFEFRSKSFGKPYRLIVSQEGSELRRWWDLEPGVQILPSLDSGLSGARARSGGSSQTVPSLLLPAAVSGRSLKDMKRVKRLDDVPCGSSVCGQVQGVYGPERRVLWVDLGTFLLRRMTSTTEFTTSRIEETTSFEPVVNEDIFPDLLAFDSPEPR
jgi:hypothetical protein